MLGSECATALAEINALEEGLEHDEKKLTTSKEQLTEAQKAETLQHINGEVLPARLAPLEQLLGTSDFFCGAAARCCADGVSARATRSSRSRTAATAECRRTRSARALSVTGGVGGLPGRKP